MTALGDRAIRWLAGVLAPTPCTGRIPGWHFAMAEDQPDFAVLVRRAVWRAGLRRGHVPVVLPWLDDLEHETPLGTDLSRCLFVSGSYEPNEFAMLADRLEPGMTFIDVGANEGLYSTFAARRVGPGGAVLAVEASPREFTRLESNLRRNGLSQVTAVQVAASDRRGEGSLRVAEEEHAGQSTLGEFAYDIASDGQLSVPLRPLDDIVAECGFPRVDAIKIDVEGAEVAVLRGAERILAEHRPLLLLEVVAAALEGQGASRQELWQLLKERGYRLLGFDDQGRPAPLLDFEVDGVNVIAVHRERDFGLPEEPALD